MLMPNMFGDSLLDDLFDFPSSRYGTGSLMDTDIKDTDNSYEVTVDMPEVKKENAKAELRDGYLTIQASTDPNKEEKGSNGRCIRRERYSGSYNGGFHVGDAVTQGDIETKFEDGTLKLLIPKREAVLEVEERKYIAIEG